MQNSIRLTSSHCLELLYGADHGRSGTKDLYSSRLAAIVDAVSRVVHVPYTIEQDEDGVWCASAQLRVGVGAVGDGETQEAAIADLREALAALIAEVGAPPELTVTLDVA